MVPTSPLIESSKYLVKGAVKWGKKHLPLICAGMSTLGLGVTITYTAIDTKNYVIAIEQEQAKLGRQLTTMEKIKVGAPEYARTGVAALITGGLIWAGYGSSKHIINGLGGSVILLDKQLQMTRDAFRDYREETQPYLPQNQEEFKKMDKIIGGRKCDEPTEAIVKPGNIIFSNDSDKVLHFKELDTGMEYFKTYNEFENARNMINADINTEGFGSLNRFHEYMGVDETEIGWDIGWMQILDCELDARLVFDDHKKPEVVIFVYFSKCPEIKW